MEKTTPQSEARVFVDVVLLTASIERELNFGKKIHP